VVFAAGGTGGHLMPALATAEALRERASCAFLMIGSPRDIERSLRGAVEYPAAEVSARGLAGRRSLGKLVTMVALPLSIARAYGHLRRFRPHLVIATGGYVCGPTGIAAWLARIPLLLLEQNASPGLTTRWLRPFARAIAVSFPETARRLGGKAIVTGNPMRSTLPAASQRRRGAAPPEAGSGGFDENARRAVDLLVLGGSQGARGLNTMVELAIPILATAEIGLRVVHQTGKRDVERLREAYGRHGIPATVTPFIHNIGDAYASADLVCARAGATTVAELAYCGLPSILVPFPGAAAHHQHDNARALASVGAAMVLEQEANGGPRAEAIIALASDRRRLRALASAAASAGRDDAASAVADIALSLVQTGDLPHPEFGTTASFENSEPSRSHSSVENR